MDPTTAVARPGVSDSDRPRLARGVRLTYSRGRQRHVLLRPESVVVLNGSGASILELCDGRRTVAEIVAELGARYRAVPDDEVRQFLARLIARRCVEPAGGRRPADGPGLDADG
ncbi:MAG: pyrroloquinoline quinone biosynthesis protein [Mycobacteriales bacterium]